MSNSISCVLIDKHFIFVHVFAFQNVQNLQKLCQRYRLPPAPWNACSNLGNGNQGGAGTTLHGIIKLTWLNPTVSSKNPPTCPELKKLFACLSVCLTISMQFGTGTARVFLRSTTPQDLWSGRTGRYLRIKRLKFKTTGKLPIILDECLELILCSNLIQENRRMSTCN